MNINLCHYNQNLLSLKVLWSIWIIFGFVLFDELLSSALLNSAKYSSFMVSLLIMLGVKQESIRIVFVCCVFIWLFFILFVFVWFRLDFNLFIWFALIWFVFVQLWHNRILFFWFVFILFMLLLKKLIFVADRILISKIIRIFYQNL